MALYDGGYALRLVPGLDAAALENNRSPEDDAQPWASLQLLLYGSDDVTAGYPSRELAAFRAAFAEAAEAYRDRGAAGRGERFSVAMNRLATGHARAGRGHRAGARGVGAFGSGPALDLT